jgi:NAD-dependent aldehyde dehydrogenases
VYATARVGNPLEDGSVLIGPLIDEPAFAAMQATLSEVHALGGKITGGDRCHAERYAAAYYVRPALIEMAEQTGPVLRETFAPLLYVMPYTDFDQAIELHNGVPQGLASSIFSKRCARGRAFSVGGGIGLRDCQRQYWSVRRRDWWCLWRRKGDGRRS